MPPPVQLVLSGVVHPRKEQLPGVGDVAIHPGSGKTSYIDATIFDGGSWRALDLKGFGVGLGSRAFGYSSDIGPLMRKIASKIISYKNAFVYYDYPADSKRRKYIFRGIPYSSFVQINPWSLI